MTEPWRNDPPEAWTDERLAAAFAARAKAHRPPVSLTNVVLATVRNAAVRTPTVPRWGRRLPAAGLVATLIVGLVAIQSVSMANVRTDASAIPAATPSPPAPTIGATSKWRVGGLDVSDQSGLVLAARAATYEEAKAAGLHAPGSGRLEAVRVSDTTVLIAWTTGACTDYELVVSGNDILEFEVASNTFNMACRGGIGFAQLFIDLARPVDVVHLTDETEFGPILTVAKAVAIRAMDDHREIAVRGWFNPPTVQRCPLVSPGLAMEWDCSGPSALFARPLPNPDDPDISLDLSGVPIDWHRRDAAANVSIELVVYGHFDDDRAASCRIKAIDACRDIFVVDRVDQVDGRQQDTNAVIDPTLTEMTIDDVRDSLKAALGTPISIMSAKVIAGRDLVAYEPATTTHRLDLFGPIWLIRVNDGPTVSRLLFAEALDNVYGVTGGRLELLSGEPPSLPADTPSALPAGVPTAVAGLPVIDVAAAIEVQERDGDDRELAVQGFYHPVNRRGPICFDDRPYPFVLGVCTASVYAGLRTGPSDGDGPGISVTLSPSVIQHLGERRFDTLPVVFVGHFDDRRSADCGGGATTEVCQDAFVVDAVWIDGRLHEPSWSWPDPGALAGPRATVDAVARLFVGVRGPDATVLSVGAIPAPDLAKVEPAAASTFRGAAWVWHVTMVQGDRATTLLVSDDHVLLAGAPDGDWTHYEVVADQMIAKVAYRT